MNRALPILAAAVVMVGGCPPDGTRPSPPLDVTRITPEAPSIVYYSGQSVPQRSAIFDEPSFAQAWARAFASRDPAPPLPEVDFEREFVVVAALGERASGGFGIEVTGAAGEDGMVVAQVEATAPGKNCVVSMAMTQPLDVVRVRRPSAGALAVRFVDKFVVRDCGP